MPIKGVDMTTPTTSSTVAADETADCCYTMEVAAPIARIIEAVTDETEIMRWWTAVSASERNGDEIRLVMGDQSLIVTVERPAEGEVTWTVTTCEMAPDWVGTEPTFTIRPNDDGTNELTFRHIGLVPSLECFDMCRAGWGHFMPSLHQYLETGEGLPNEPRRVSA